MALVDVRVDVREVGGGDDGGGRTPSPRFEIVDAAASLTNPEPDLVASVVDIVDARRKRRMAGRKNAEYDAVDGGAFAGRQCE